MAARPKPFQLSVPETALAGLKARLAMTRFPDQAPDGTWAYGTDLEYLRSLVGYWRDSFDWRAQEAALNAYPQFKVKLHDIDVHYLHVPGQGPSPLPLLLIAWLAGIGLRVHRHHPPPDRSARFGGDPADAFTVIAPSLPCFGLSFTSGQKRFSVPAMAACLSDLMTEVLCDQRYAIQGGDIGAGVAARLGHAHPQYAAGSAQPPAASQPPRRKPGAVICRMIGGFNDRGRRRHRPTRAVRGTDRAPRPAGWSNLRSTLATQAGAPGIEGGQK